MIISVASGKGGTGKTTVSVNLSFLIENSLIADCDVEEPNVSIFLKPEISKREIVTLPYPQVNKEICNTCGICSEICAYKAINVFKKSKSVFFMEHLCHSCGACAYFCPQKAISEVRKRIGVIEYGKYKDVLYIGGILDEGNIKAPQLIRELKKRIDKTKNIIIDAPPSTSCSMVAAVEDSDFCIMVTEPTLFGLNDLLLAIDVVKKMNIKFGVLINRFRENSDFENILKSKNINIIGKIPFDIDIARMYSRGEILVENPKYRDVFLKIYENLKKLL
jgi:MinD superfamily P-loop ATPase